LATKSSSRSNQEEINEPELTPEEAALVLRIGVFVNMRWLAIAGVIIASLLADLVLNVRFPLTPLYVICAVMVVYNFVLFLQARNLKVESSGSTPQSLAIRLGNLAPVHLMPKRGATLIEKARFIGNIHIALDLVALIMLLHFTGGIENPFIFYFIFHVMIAGILLHYRVVYFLATAAILLVSLLVGLEYSGLIPHVHLEGFASADLYQQGNYILGILIALATCIYGSAYMVTQISGGLRKRQREVVTLKDIGISEKVKELRDISKELARLEEGRGKLLHFLGIVAHDLKAPLSAVQSYLQLMVGGFVGTISDKQREMMDRSIYRINGLLNLISDLLDISRIESGQIVSEVEETSLLAVIEDSIEDAHALAESKNIKLKVEVPKTLPQIQASDIRIQQVITNLLSNAIKFTPEKGNILIRAINKKSLIQVEVADTGTGIRSEDMPHIFEDFYRGGDQAKAGTGLGLSIAKRVIEAHGGRIWAESPNPEDAKGRGCKFCCTLPKKPVQISGKKEKVKPGKKQPQV